MTIAKLGTLVMITGMRIAACMHTLPLLRHASRASCGSLKLCIRPDPDEILQRVSPVSIAYLGDAVWEQEVRERMLWPPSKLDTLSSRVQSVCCAEGQHQVLNLLLEDFDLTAGELEWIRRGRNASGRGPRRLNPKVYRASTSLETLVGVLHLTDSRRLAELFHYVFSHAVDANGIITSSPEAD